MPSRAVQPQTRPPQRSAAPRWTPRRRQEVEEEVVDREPSNDHGVTMGRAAGAERLEEKPVTKNGFPDRRFRGQRDLPEPSLINPDYRRARVGGVVDETHVTLGGKPDRRFKENRALSDEEALDAQIEALQAQRAQTRH